MTTYTVINRSSGTPEARGLSATDAADIILTHDGATYELRHEADHDLDGQQCWQLYVNSAHGHSRMTECYTGVSGHSKLARAYAANRDEAWLQIVEQVVTGCYEWRCAPDVMTDADYDAMIAELEAE